MNFLDSVPETARRAFEDGWFYADNAGSFEAAKKLVSDPRMGNCWKKLAQRADVEYRDESGDYGWAETFLVEAVHQFDMALNPGSGWTRLPKREQMHWVSEFKAAVERLDHLVQQGPLPDSQTEIATFLRDLSAYEKRIRQDMPPFPGEATDIYWRRLVESPGGPDLAGADFEEMCDRPTYHFSAVLKRYADAQLWAARSEGQQLKKPRDPKADRARFLQGMTACCYALCGTAMQEVVATTGAVLFEDEAITVRLVRIHTEQLRSRDSSEK